MAEHRSASGLEPSGTTRGYLARTAFATGCESALSMVSNGRERRDTALTDKLTDARPAGMVGDLELRVHPEHPVVDCALQCTSETRTGSDAFDLCATTLEDSRVGNDLVDHCDGRVDSCIPPSAHSRPGLATLLGRRGGPALDRHRRRAPFDKRRPQIVVALPRMNAKTHELSVPASRARSVTRLSLVPHPITNPHGDLVRFRRRIVIAVEDPEATQLFRVSLRRPEAL